MGRIGRYEIGDVIGSGGMAAVHVARMSGPSGFGRILAVKRLHPHLACQSHQVVMLLDEARISARIRSPFVVQTLDVVTEGEELLLVMEYVHGISLNRVVDAARARGERLEPGVVSSIMVHVLAGLHAAHELADVDGSALELVHRDVSPQNVLVGSDGLARLLDFGIARALGRLTATQDGYIKGKLAYMASEQLEGQPVDRRTDVFAASVGSTPVNVRSLPLRSKDSAPQDRLGTLTFGVVNSGSVTVGLTVGMVRSTSFLDLSSTPHPSRPSSNGMASSASNQPSPGVRR